MSTRSTIAFFVDFDTDCSIHVYEELVTASTGNQYRIEVDGVHESFNLAIPKELAMLIKEGKQYKSGLSAVDESKADER